MIFLSDNGPTPWASEDYPGNRDSEWFFQFDTAWRSVMNLMAVVVSFLGLSGVSTATAAGSMRCGTDIIEGGQREPVSLAEVKQRCGSPDSETGDTLTYKMDDSVYVLRFNPDGALVEINEKAQQ